MKSSAAMRDMRCWAVVIIHPVEQKCFLETKKLLGKNPRKVV
jgi:hypothetical protein